MQHSKGTRLVASAALALGLTFSLTACDAGDVGKAPVAAENKAAGVTVREDQVQRSTADYKSLLSAVGTDPSKFDTPQAMYALSLEPIFADAAQKLGVGVSLDDAKKDIDEILRRVKTQRPGTELPAVTDDMAHIRRVDLLIEALNGATQKKEFVGVRNDLVKKIQSGWTFGGRYGGFVFGDSGPMPVDAQRPWLGTYVPVLHETGLGTGDGGPNGRPIEEVQQTPAPQEQPVPEETVPAGTTPGQTAPAAQDTPAPAGTATTPAASDAAPAASDTAPAASDTTPAPEATSR